METDLICYFKWEQSIDQKVDIGSFLILRSRKHLPSHSLRKEEQDRKDACKKQAGI